MGLTQDLPDGKLATADDVGGTAGTLLSVCDTKMRKVTVRYRKVL